MDVLQMPDKRESIMFTAVSTLSLGTHGRLLVGLCVAWHCSYDLVVCGVVLVLCGSAQVPFQSVFVALQATEESSSEEESDEEEEAAQVSLVSCHCPFSIPHVTSHFPFSSIDWHVSQFISLFQVLTGPLVACLVMPDPYCCKHI